MNTLYAWAHGVKAGELVPLLTPFPGLGVVLNGSNYAAAANLDIPPIAYVTTLDQARAVRSLMREGVAFRAALVNDERNGTGPSGSYMSPEEYAAKFTPIYETLRGYVPVSTMGLMPVGGFWRTLLWSWRFDDEYHAQLPPADLRAFNPNKVRRGELYRVLRTYPGQWILSPAPFRSTWWERLWSPIDVATWGFISEREDVLAVAFWCLREVYGTAEKRMQYEHGLLDAKGQITNVGREVQAALRRLP